MHYEERSEEVAYGGGLGLRESETDHSGAHGCVSRVTRPCERVDGSGTVNGQWIHFLRSIREWDVL